jgi:hypothetical protein
VGGSVGLLVGEGVNVGVGSRVAVAVGEGDDVGGGSVGVGLGCTEAAVASGSIAWVLVEAGVTGLHPARRRETTYNAIKQFPIHLEMIRWT